MIVDVFGWYLAVAVVGSLMFLGLRMVTTRRRT